MSFTFCFITVIVINAQKSETLYLRKNFKLIETFDFSQEIWYQLTFTKKSELFLVTKNQTANKWYYRKGNIKREFSPCVNSTYTVGVLTDDGNTLAVSCENYFIEIWDLVETKMISRFQVPKNKDSNSLRPYISNDGRRILIKFGGIGEFAELWNAVSGRKIATLTSEATECFCNRTVYYANGFSPDGKIVAVSFGGMTFLWDAETGKLLNRLIDEDVSFYGSKIMTHKYGVNSLIFNKSGKIIITASADGATSWNAETGELIQKFKQNPPREIYAVALSPDEKTIVTGGYSRNIRLWDFENGNLLWKSPDVKKTVKDLSFSPDGKKILSRTDNRFVIWDAATGKSLEQISFSEEVFPRVSPDWKLITLYNKKAKTIGLYEYLQK